MEEKDHTDKTTAYPGGAPNSSSSTETYPRSELGIKTEEAKKRAHDTKEQALRKAESVTQELKERGRGLLEEQRGKIGSQIGIMSDVLHQSAGRLREGHDETIAAYASDLATRIDRVRDYVEHRDLREIFRDIERVARDHPQLFFGTLFLGGLFLARFLKAGSPKSSQPYGEVQPEKGRLRHDPASGAKTYHSYHPESDTPRPPESTTTGTPDIAQSPQTPPTPGEPGGKVYH